MSFRNDLSWSASPSEGRFGLEDPFEIEFPIDDPFNEDDHDLLSATRLAAMIQDEERDA